MDSLESALNTQLDNQGLDAAPCQQVQVRVLRDIKKSDASISVTFNQNNLTTLAQTTERGNRPLSSTQQNQSRFLDRINITLKSKQDPKQAAVKSPEKGLGSANEKGIAAPRAKNAPFGLNTDLFILQEQYSEARASPQVRKTPK